MQILKIYQRRLLNLSSSNRSLLLLRPSQSQHFDLHELDYLLPDTSFSIIRNLLTGKNKSLLPVSDSRHAPNYKLSRQLLQINRKAKLIWEERGAKELYAGWPFVHGCLADNTFVRCPLLFFPITLIINNKQEWELHPDPDRQPHFNKSFLLAYAHYQQQNPDENLLDFDVSELPADATQFRTALYELLKDSQLDLNFNQELFSDQLQSFTSYRKAEFDKIWKPGQLKLMSEAVLGVFPQAASYLLSDYEDLLQEPDLVTAESLFNQPEERKKVAREQQVYSVLEMDASQEAALLAVKNGNSVVVQGPPGTGKSQLICNLAADFMARGKKVLVVCQKRAALDVVHKRLSSKKLGAFAGLVHDIHTERKLIFEQLNNQVDSVEVYQKQNLDFGNIYADRQYLQTCKQIDRITEKLQNFKTALFDDSICGWPVKELYLRSNLQNPAIDLSRVYQQITAENLAQVSQDLLQALQYRQLLQPVTFWKDRHSLNNFTWQQQQELQQVITHFPNEISEIAQKITAKTLSLPESWQLLNQLLPEENEIETALQNLEEQQVKAFFELILEKQLKITALLIQVKKLKQFLQKNEFPKALFTEEDLENATKLISGYQQKKERLIRQLNWHLLSNQKKQLRLILEKNNLQYAEPDVCILQTRITNKQQALKQLSAIYQKLNITAPVFAESPEELVQDLTALQTALETTAALHKLQKKLPALNLICLSGTESIAAQESTAKAIADFNSKRKQWQKYLTDAQLELLAESDSAAAECISQLNRHFEYLVAADYAYQKLSLAEKSILESLSALETTPEKAIAVFENSLFLAWINHIEQQFPELRIVSNGQMEQLEAQLKLLLQTKQELSQHIVEMRVREQTYSNLEFNRLGNRITYRKLQAQVQKKRQLYPLRKLFSLFSDEIFKLVPCWLASPDTVSALFPLQPLFDLVIFDEASQCFSEQGLPAIFRGRQTVITGDNKQLRPTDMYRVRWQQDEENEEELAVESLLDLGNLYLKNYMLTEHYRSRFPELIAFSNKHFYKQKLQLIPDKEVLQSAKPAIEYHHISGIWENNSNLPEAEFVVEKVITLLHENITDIGIITFNFMQQQLIQDLLETTAQQNQIILPETVSVKNIENIQGDEKQVIILSPAYAPDKSGKVRLQFGSLNTESGENRLNVAVTRAITKIIVMSSLQPEQLMVENARHSGPKLLRKYLEFARAVSAGEFKPEALVYPEPAHGFMLKKQLLNQEFIHQVKTKLLQELPFADLTVKQNGAYKQVILTDDDQYFQQQSVKHIHAGLPYRLETHHWLYKRIYSRQWWQNPQHTVAQLT